MQAHFLRIFVAGSLLAMATTPVLYAGDGKIGKVEASLGIDDHINNLRNGDLEKKLEALGALQALGPKAKAAVPDLIAALRHNESRIQYAAVLTLIQIGADAKEALPTLKLLLANPKEIDRFYAHHLIHATIAIGQKIDLETARLLAIHKTVKVGTPLVYGYLDTHAAELTPHLIKLLDDLDVEVRTVASGAFLEMTKEYSGKESTIIKKLGDKAKPIGPALVKQLDDPNATVVFAAANALTHVDPELGPKAIPVVLKILKAGNQKLVNSYEVAGILKPISKAAIPPFIEALDEKNAGIREEVAAALAQLDGAIEPLAKALQHKKTLVRAGAAKALATMYTSGAPAAPELVKALKDSELIVRFAAADALVVIGTDRSREAVPVLVEVIRDGNEEEKKHAVGLLAHIGPPAKAALPSLIALLKDERFPVRFEAALALTTIDAGEGAKAVSALIEGAKSDDNYKQQNAAKALAAIGPPAKEAVPALEKLFEAKYVHARYSAAEAVARIDPSKVESAIKVIVATLQDKKNKSSMVRNHALSSLRRIGPAAISAIPALDEMLKDKGPFHAEIAVTALGIGGENAKAAVQFIREHLVKQPLDDEGYDLFELLPQFGANAKLFIPEIRTVLEKGKTPYVQEHICEMIESIGPHAKELEPQLRALIEKAKRKQTKEAAEKALVAIGVKK